MIPPSAGNLTMVGQVLVPVQDVERATAFYRDTLGMTFLFAYPGAAFFECGGVRIYLAVPENEEMAGHPLVYYRVLDVRATFAVLEGRGVSFLGEPHVVHRDATSEHWMAFFRDSEGNTLALMAEVQVAG